MANRNKSNELIKYLVQTAKGDFIMEVPANWKVTFGAVNPGAPPHGRDLHCLRIWEGEKLRAVHCDVRGFRDLSIPLARKVEVQTGASTWTKDSTGNFEGTEKVDVNASFQLEGGNFDFDDADVVEDDQ